MKKIISSIIISFFLVSLFFPKLVIGQQDYKNEKDVLEEAVQVINKPSYEFNSFEENVYSYIKTQLPEIKINLDNIRFEILNLYMEILMDEELTSSHTNKIKEIKNQTDKVGNEISKYERMLKILDLIKPQFEKTGFIEEYPKDQELYFVGFHTASNPIEREGVYGFSNGSFRFTDKSTALKLEKEGFVEDHLFRLTGENLICLDILTWRDKFEKGEYYTSEDIKELGGNPKEIEYTTRGNVEFSDGRCSGHAGTYKGDFVIESCPASNYLIFKDGIYKGKEIKITEECKKVELFGFKNNKEEVTNFLEKIERLIE